jgi:hypothetical protein
MRCQNCGNFLSVRMEGLGKPGVGSIIGYYLARFNE